MKKIIPFVLYVIELAYEFFAFSVYSCRFPIMPWYESDQMGIQIGLGMLRLLFVGALAILAILFLFRDVLGFVFLVISFSIVIISLPAFAEEILSIKVIEYMGSVSSLVLLIMSGGIFFYLITKKLWLTHVSHP